MGLRLETILSLPESYHMHDLQYINSHVLALQSKETSLKTGGRSAFSFENNGKSQSMPAMPVSQILNNWELFCDIVLNHSLLQVKKSSSPNVTATAQKHQRPGNAKKDKAIRQERKAEKEAKKSAWVLDWSID